MEQGADQALARMQSVLAEADISGRHVRLWGMSAGGTLLDGLALACFGIALPLIKQSYAMSELMIGAIGAAYVLGMVTGALAGGRASDRYGRRRLFMLSMSAIAVVSLVSSFAWAPWVILVSQFLLGCAVGSEFPNSSAYVSDVMPDRSRGRMLVATIMAQAIGMIIGVAIGLAMLQQDPHVDVWRWFLGIRFVVAIMVLAARTVAMPESPLWLMLQGRNTEASKAIDRIVPGQREVLQELAATARDRKMSSSSGETGPKPGLAVLFSKPYRRRTMLAAGAWFLMDISTYGVGQFAPTILEKLSTGGKSSGVIAAELSSIEGALVLDGFLLLGFILGMWAVPRFGQVRMQAIGFVGMVFGMCTLYLAITQSGGHQPIMPLVFAGFIIFNLLMNAGPNSTTFGMAALLFPAELRATAAGFSAGCAKVGATLGLFLLPSISAAIGIANTLLMLGGLSALACAITVLLGRGLALNES